MSDRAQNPKYLSPEASDSILELRAVEQRRRLHNTIVDLRHTVAERTDIKKLARNHLWPAAGVASLLGWILGYGTAKFFTR
jgi:hypothetical protein